MHNLLFAPTTPTPEQHIIASKPHQSFPHLPRRAPLSKVFTKKRGRGKWYQHAPLMGVAIGPAIEFTTLFALVGMKMAMDGENQIGVHVAPTFVYALTNLNMNCLVMANDLVLLRSALRSPLARGDQTQRQIEARIRSLTMRRAISTVPILLLDVPSLVSVCITPRPGPDDPVLLLKRVVYLVRVVQLIVGISLQYWNTIRTDRLLSVMFTQVRPV